MSWPTPQDYNEAIQNPQLNFTDPELWAGVPEMTPLGLPRAITGGFASVYRLRCSGRDWAVRCFLREVPDQQERYAAIGRHLAAVNLPYTVGFAFQPAGITVGGRAYPLLKMEWVAGEPLERWIEDHLGDPVALRALADRWVALLRALRGARIAHGDLQHGNILIVNGEPRLIDYDGMFVPDLAGRQGNEVGHRNYQHPQRGVADFGPGIDAFAAWTIYLSLRALSIAPALWQQLGAGDEGLLLRREDYVQPVSSSALRALEGIADPELHRLLVRFRTLLTQSVGALPALPGTDTVQTPARRSPAPRRQRVAPTPIAPRPPAQITGAAAWLPDHLAPTAALTLVPSYRLERGLLGVLVGSLIGLILGACAGLLAVSVAALAGGLVVLLVFFALVGRYIALPHWSSKFAVQAWVWRTQLRLLHLGVLGRGAERQLRQLDEREIGALTAIAERRQGYAREIREALTAIDRTIARFAVERQLLAQAEDDELVQALRDLRQHHAADHLTVYPILAAAIPGVGPQLKLRLLTAGIRTAAQIRDLRVTPVMAGVGAGAAEVVEIEVPGRGFVQVQGLGRQKAQALVAWRQLLEAEAVALLPEALTSAEESAIRLRYHTRREGLARREAAAIRSANRRREALRAQLRARHAALERQEAALRDRAASPRARSEATLAERQTAVAAAHLALALARRDLAAYEQVCFTNYLQGILFS